MNGFYTEKGADLAVKLQTGVKLVISKATVGSGISSRTSVKLDQEKQTATVGTPVVRNRTAELPVTLPEVQVVQDFSLTELGIYADDPDEGEILYQVYRLNHPHDVMAGGEDSLRLVPKITIGQGGIEVPCSPAGMLIDEDLTPIRSSIAVLQNKVLANYVSTRSVSVAPSELQAYLNSLPRMLTETLTIQVTGGSITGDILVYGFYGSGHLKIQGAGVTVTGCVDIEDCRCGIDVSGFSVQAADTMTSIYHAPVVVRRCDETHVIECTVNGNGSCSGFVVDLHSMAVIADCSISNCMAAVNCNTNSACTVYNLTGSFSGNTIGIRVHRGGLVMLSDDTPDMLGGSTNIKSGGMIISADGTIL